MHLNKDSLLQLDRIKRLNVVNAVSGIKPANLIGTISNSRQANVAIFSSVIHLGSNPALLGFISRPSKDVRRHTLENILETQYYTINHVHKFMIEKAHYTSAKFEKNQSEFEYCGLTEEYLFDFKAPFVKESRVKLGMRLMDCQPIELNGTLLVIGEIQHIILPDEAIHKDGHIDIASLDGVGLSGLNNYYQIEKLTSLPYARVSEVPDFMS